MGHPWDEGGGWGAGGSLCSLDTGTAPAPAPAESRLLAAGGEGEERSRGCVLSFSLQAVNNNGEKMQIETMETWGQP